MSLVWQSVFPESRMISKILPENGFPRQCAHWLGMTLYLRFVYNLNPAGFPAGFCYITLTSLPGARKNKTPSFTGFWKIRVSASA